MIRFISCRLSGWRVVLALLFLNFLWTPLCVAQYDDDATDKVVLDVHLDQTIGPMDPVWAYFGYDEANYTYKADGKKLLTELSQLSPVPVYVRAHNLLNTDEGPRADLKWGSTNVYTEDEEGNPVYDWTVMDRIMDTYVERGMKPLVEIGFMPKALSSNPEPYRHDWAPGAAYEEIYTGWAYPPTDYEKWAELVYRWVQHSIDRYGRGTKWKPGSGRSGTSRTSGTGGGPKRSISSSTTTRRMPCGGPCPRRRLVARTPRGRGGSRRRNGCEISSTTARMVPTTRRARPARPSTSSPTTRKGLPRWLTATCA